METYNKKAFLLPDSDLSMACYHATVVEDFYRFRIHDCREGIQLHGDLKTREEAHDAVNKLMRLSVALSEMANFIKENY